MCVPFFAGPSNNSALIKWFLSGAGLGSLLQSHPLGGALVTLAGLGAGRWPQECPLWQQLSLAGGDDTSQCFQEILKIPALQKAGRAEDLRERRRWEAFCLQGLSRGGRGACSQRDTGSGAGSCGGASAGLSHHPQCPCESPRCWAGRGCGCWLWSSQGLLQGRAQAWLSHHSLCRTIASSSAEGAVENVSHPEDSLGGDTFNLTS